jgi:sortase A
MVLSGHISSPIEGGVFRRLPQLKVGYAVIVFTNERPFLYRVSDTRVMSPDDVSVMDPRPGPTATLITCVPDGIYTERLIATCQLVS